jgi:subtilisin family serine protease
MTMSRKRKEISSTHLNKSKKISKENKQLQHSLETLKKEKKFLTETVIFLSFFLLIVIMVQSIEGGEVIIHQGIGELIVNERFSEDITTKYSLDGVPHSLLLSGNFSGNNSKVYAIIGNNRYLVLDTDSIDRNNPEELVHFNNTCKETCNIDTILLNFSLEIQTDGELFIETVRYSKLIDGRNFAPEWRGRNIFIVDNAKTFTLDLDEFVSDLNHDKIKYHVSEDILKFISINESKLSFIASQEIRGEKSMTLSFSDGFVSKDKEISFFIIGELPEDETDRPFIDPKLVDELYRKDKARVIIELEEEDPLKKKAVITELSPTPTKDTTDDNKLGKAISIIVNAQEIRKDILIENNYKTNNLISAEISSEGLKRLESSNKIKAIYIDPILKLDLEESLELVNWKTPLAIESSQGEVRLNGKGHAICIIDTGIAKHQDLDKQIIEDQCFCSVSDLGLGGCCPNAKRRDNSGRDDSLVSHGTKVAGIIGANGKLKGVAPGAGIVAVKACDFLGRCLGSDIISAIDYCVSNKESFEEAGFELVSISGSFSDGEKYDTIEDCPSTFDRALNSSWINNIIPVFSSGNEFSREGIGLPACSRYSLSVGAITKAGTIASYSNRGNLLDMLAPGDNIKSTSRNYRYSSSSGTSMAAPHVAGAIAIIKQEEKLNEKTYKSEEIIESLRKAGALIGGYPLLDIKNTILLLEEKISSKDYVRPRASSESNIRSTDLSSFKESLEEGEGYEIKSMAVGEDSFVRVRNTEIQSKEDVAIDISRVSTSTSELEITTTTKNNKEFQEISIVSGEYILELEGDNVIDYALEEGLRDDQEIKAYSNSLNTQQLQIMEDLSELNVKTKYQLNHVYNGLVIEAEEYQIEDITNMAGVKAVYPSVIVKANLRESLEIINATHVWNLQNSGINITGKGVKIAIIDTGVDYAHEDLGGCFGSGCKVVGGYDYVNDDNSPIDDHGHGTHVAATAAGNGILKGVAPDAEILAYKVLGSGGSGSSGDITAAINAAVLAGADIISMSLGGGGSPTSPMSAVSNNAMKAGVVVVAAAGNSGPGKETVLSPGNANEIITVGATNKNDQMASFSSRGPTINSILKPEIVAPGVSICAAQWDSAWANSKCSPHLENHVAISGTSMATPHVAGAIALLKQIQPNLTTQELKSVVVSSAKDLGYGVNSQGGGRLDLENAIYSNLHFEPSIINLGEIKDDSVTKSIRIHNYGDKDLLLSFASSKLSNGINESDSISTPQNSMVLTPGESKNISLTVNLTEIQGNLGGIIKVSTNDSRIYTVPIAVSKFNTLVLEFKHSQGTFWPATLVAHDKEINYYETKTRFGYKVTLNIPKEDRIYYHIIEAGDSQNHAVISGYVDVVAGENYKEINREEYELVEIPATTFDGKALDLPYFGYYLKLTGTKRSLTVGKSFSSDFLHGSQNIRMTKDFNFPFKKEVSVQYFGIPETSHKNLWQGKEQDNKWNKNRYAGAAEMYFIGKIVDSVDQLNFSYDKSNFGAYRYNYNYHKNVPEFYRDVTFWESPWIVGSWSPFRTLAAPITKTRYIQDNGYGQWHYVGISSPGDKDLATRTAKSLYMKEDYRPTTSWPRGIRGKSGEVQEIYFGTSPYSLPIFQNSQTAVRVVNGRKILLGKNKRSNVVRPSSVTYSGTKVNFIEPEIEIINAETGEEISKRTFGWDWSSHYQYVTANKLRTILRIDPQYEVFNTTIDTLFRKGENPPMIKELGAPTLFNDTYNLGFNVTSSNNVKSATLEFQDKKAKWKKVTLDSGNNNQNDYTYSLDSKDMEGLEELNVRITLEVDKDTKSVYEISSIASRAKGLSFSLNLDNQNPKIGDTLTFSGKCTLGNGSDCKGIGVSFEYNNKQIGSDISDFDTNTFSYKMKYLTPGVFKLIFPGTGWFDKVVKTINIGNFTDANPPTITNKRTIPASQSFIFNDVSVSLQANVVDDIEVKQVFIIHNASGEDTQYSTSKLGNTYSASIHNSLLENQQSVGWKVSTEDYAGNSITSNLSTFKVQNRAPVANNLSKMRVEETQRITINLNATDPDGDSLEIKYPSPFDEKGRWKTAEGDAGNYSFVTIVKDPYSSIGINLEVEVTTLPKSIPPAPEPEPKPKKDKYKRLQGDFDKLVKKHFKELKLKIGDSYNLTDDYEGRKRIKFEDEGKDILEFFHEFNEGKEINMSKIILEKQKDNETRGALLVKGINLTNETKTIYLDNINLTVSTICVKDKEINELSEISSTCKGNSEFMLNCADQNLQYDKYTCTESGTKYRITGLEHSGAVEICVDEDMDGSCTPIDCNDEDSSINPEGIEICGDSIDQDCTGSDLSCPVSEPVPSSPGSGSSGGGSSGGGSSGSSSPINKISLIEKVIDAVTQKAPTPGDEGSTKDEEKTARGFEERFAQKTAEICSTTSLHKDDPNKMLMDTTCKNEQNELSIQSEKLINKTLDQNAVLLVILILLLMTLGVTYQIKFGGKR